MINIEDFIKEIPVRKTEQPPVQKQWHTRYAIFSFNEDCFGWVTQDWYPSDGREYPEAEYDYDYNKGFRLYSQYYADENLDFDESRRLYENGKDPNFEFESKCYLVPILCYDDINEY